MLFFADAASVVSSSIAPVITKISLLSSAFCALFVMIGGYQYITSSGNPESLLRAKRIIKNALIGLVIVLAAALLSNFLKSAYGPLPVNGTNGIVPSLSAIKPTSSSSGLITVIIKAITGVLSAIVETVAIPFLKALSYFTSGTPLAAANHSVFNLWVSSVGIADSLMVLCIVLLGLHVMGFYSLGIGEVNIRQLLPQISIAFMFINSSIFIIDAVIGLSNILIKAISGNEAAHSVWNVLSEVVKQPSAYGLAALIIMTIFLVFSVILLIFYVGRIVTIYLGAVLAPMVILCWLLPGLRDMAISASKRYFSAIFVLFVHVVILELAASLLSGIISTNQTPDPLMAMIVGLATLVALLKTQGVMNQLSYASIGPRMSRQIAERIVLGASYIGSQAVNTINSYLPTNSERARGRNYSNSNSLKLSNLPETTSAGQTKPLKPPMPTSRNEG
jgi:hypothetical protein